MILQYPIRVISNLRSDYPHSKNIGPSWYDFAELSISSKLMRLYDQALVTNNAKAVNLVVGEHSFGRAQLNSIYQIILFTDSPTYLLSGNAIENADTLYVFDSEQYHRVLIDINKVGLKTPSVKIIPSKYFPSTFEPVRRSKKLYGFVQSDFYTDAKQACEPYIAFSKLYMEPEPLPVDLAFYVYSQESKDMLLNSFSYIKTVKPLPVHVLDTDGFTSLDSTPNAVIFTERSNHFSPLQFMLNSKIQYKHAYAGFDECASIRGNPDRLRSVFLDFVNQMEHER